MGKTKSAVVEAVGVAVRTGGGLGRAIEAAMAASILDIQAESEKIWARSDIDVGEKGRLIAAINSDEAKRARMMAAREAVKQAHRAATAKAKGADDAAGAR